MRGKVKIHGSKFHANKPKLKIHRSDCVTQQPSAVGRQELPYSVTLTTPIFHTKSLLWQVVTSSTRSSSSPPEAATQQSTNKEFLAIFYGFNAINGNVLSAKSNAGENTPFPFKWHTGLCRSARFLLALLWLSVWFCLSEEWFPELFILPSSTHNNHMPLPRGVRKPPCGCRFLQS